MVGYTKISDVYTAVNEISDTLDDNVYKFSYSNIAIGEKVNNTTQTIHELQSSMKTLIYKMGSILTDPVMKKGKKIRELAKLQDQFEKLAE